MRKRIYRRAHYFCAFLFAFSAPACVSSSPEDTPPDAAGADIFGADAADGAAKDARREVPDTSNMPVGQGDSWQHSAPDSAGDYPEEPPESCEELMSCVNDCPEAIGSCAAPCHEAASLDARRDFEALMNCIGQHHCRRPDCAMWRCAGEFMRCSR